MSEVSKTQKVLDDLRMSLEEERYALTEKYWRTLIASEITLGFMPICVCENCGTIREGALIARIVERVTNGR
jgi:hypothetical protein